MGVQPAALNSASVLDPRLLVSITSCAVIHVARSHPGAHIGSIRGAPCRGGVANRSIPSSVGIDMFATILGVDAAHTNIVQPVLPHKSSHVSGIETLTLETTDTNILSRP